MVEICSINIDTPLGKMIACATDKGVCVLEFADDKKQTGQKSEILEKYFAGKVIYGKSNVLLDELQSQLDLYFQGKLKEFTVPLDMVGTEFQKSVWNVMRDIPYGQTISYKEEAGALGNPKGIRAVASANGRNKIAIVIPCHRVIGSDGKLVGYSSGLDRKEWLLRHEQADL